MSRKELKDFVKKLNCQQREWLLEILEELGTY